MLYCTMLYFTQLGYTQLYFSIHAMQAYNNVTQLYCIILHCNVSHNPEYDAVSGPAVTLRSDYNLLEDILLHAAN